MIITIANNKGGVAKTTLAVHFATWLAMQGKKVLLVDLDTQGSVARFLGLPPGDDLAELFHVIINLSPARRPELRSFITGVSGYPSLALIRGWQKSARLEGAFAQPDTPSATTVLQEAVGPLLQLPKVVIIIDTGPYAGTLQAAAITLADHIFVPGKPEGASESGLLDIAKRMHTAGRTVTGVIPTMVNPRTCEHRRAMEDWRRALGAAVYYEPTQRLYGLTNRIIWGELPGRGRPIWDVAPRDPAAEEMQAILRRATYDAEIA